MTDCIFCKIVAGDIPSAKVYEDEQVLAFLDITQVTKGHTLIIPKAHVDNLFEMETDTASQLFAVVPKLAKHLKETLNATGLNLVNNNGETAGQTVFHSHLHLLPRFDQTDGLQIVFNPKDPDFTALGDLAQSLYLEA